MRKKTESDIIRFNMMLRKELTALGLDMADEKVWSAMQRISEETISYAAAFHQDIVRGKFF
jgi:hypothetical protein